MSKTAGKTRRLTLKQRKFVAHYVATGNASESAREAGYSEASAREIGMENLTKPAIQQAIQNATDSFFNKRECTKKERLEFLATVMRSESEDTRNRIKSCELLGRVGGDYVTRIEAKVETTDVPQFDVSQLTRDQAVLVECLQVFALPSTPQSERARIDQLWGEIQSWPDERKRAVFDRKANPEHEPDPEF